MVMYPNKLFEAFKDDRNAPNSLIRECDFIGDKFSIGMRHTEGRKQHEYGYSHRRYRKVRFYSSFVSRYNGKKMVLNEKNIANHKDDLTNQITIHINTD